MKIIFVCLGNICRSPLAETVFSQKVVEANLTDRFKVDSAGTAGYHIGQKADPRMRATARRHGLEITHLGQKLSSADISKNDLILAMDHDNYADILTLCKTSEEREKIKLFRNFDPVTTDGQDVPDPYYGGEEGFENVFNIVERTAENLLQEIAASVAR